MTSERADAVLGIVVKASLEDYMFERLDNLHKRGIHDNEVIRFLRKEGLNDVAARYIEWSGAIDPDAEDDNTTMNPAVPDPGDASSYAELFAADGINADNLEQAIVQAAVEGQRLRRIERGIFYAEPSVTSGWNVYKKRSGEDNGAFIGHYADENAAINILASLGDGHP